MRDCRHDQRAALAERSPRLDASKRHMRSTGGNKIFAAKSYSVTAAGAHHARAISSATCSAVISRRIDRARIGGGRNGEVARVWSRRSRSSISSRSCCASTSTPDACISPAPALDARFDRRCQENFVLRVRQHDGPISRPAMTTGPPAAIARCSITRRSRTQRMRGNRRNARGHRCSRRALGAVRARRHKTR